MLKRFLKLFSSSENSGPLIVQDADHTVSHYDVSRSACGVIDQLQKAGYTAYLVGGGVRDLLLGDRPKDFDVATDATPEEIKKVFRSARIIGRRFRIVHVRLGREIIEVTTFRGSPTDTGGNSGDHSRSDKGVLLRDNVYGDIKSDALRRDFTVNALYYSPSDGAILDYTNGLADLEARQLRLIGDPDARYKEDPVRMLRAVRFAAKLGFSMTPETEQPIHQHADYLRDVPPARLFEEVLKLFISGYATAALTILREFGLLKYLFPSTDECLDTNDDFCERFVFGMATNTDKRLRGNKRVTPAFIFAVLLWPALRLRMSELIDKHQFSHHDALQHAAQGVIEQQLCFTSIPKRFLIPMREIWALQLRLPMREGRRAYTMLEHPRFRAAYDFLLLREEAGECFDGLGMWWTRFQDVDEEARNAMVVELAEQSKNTGPRRRNRGRSKQNGFPRRT